MIERAGGSDFLNMLSAALKHGVYEGRSRYVSTWQLQLVSMQVCRVVRGTIFSGLKVDECTPRSVWDAVVRGKHDSVGLTALPVMQVWWVRWDDVHRQLRNVEWPDSLRGLTLGEHINPSLEGVAWSPLLEKLTVQCYADQPLDDVVWPPSLKELTLGGGFQQPIEGVTWPSSFQRLMFTDRFNQPIGAVVWPVSLQQLTLCG